MTDYKITWAEAIKDLLEKHGLTARAAAAKVGYGVSHSYISDWLRGREPKYEVALKFLDHFPREEAIECLQAANMPIPAEWQPKPKPASAVIEIALRKINNGKLSDEAKQQLMDIVHDIEAGNISMDES